VSLIDQRIQRIFQEVFENDTLAVSDALSPETMREWDSLAQLKLIMGCEEEFGIKFTIDETIGSNSVGRLKSVLISKGVSR
jgi:acyl carrier protein